MTAPIPDYSKVQLLLPMSGANNGGTFVDRSPAARQITRGGNSGWQVYTSTTHSKFYGSSAYMLEGHLSAPMSLPETWTIRCWLRIVDLATTRGVFFHGILSSNTNRVQLNVTQNGAANLHFNTSVTTVTVTTAAGAIVPGTWQHVECNYDGSIARVFVDGVLAAAGAARGGATASNMYVGVARGGDIIRYINGYIQDFCISEGVLHTANFTPPPRLMGGISVETRDESGILVPRKIFAVPRSYPSLVTASGETDANGVATLSLPACEHTVVALSDDNTLPDLVLRRVPT